jgi:signal peptidase I
MDDPAVTTTEEPAAPPSAPAKSQADQSEANIKETIESIIVAFILAFIFRAFVVEAFVIPTGSMAPTLLGAHMRFRCPDCGYNFDVNYSPNSDSDDMIIPDRAYGHTYSIICPNCGYRMPRQSGDSLASANAPPEHYGERIIEQNYLYLLQQPHRNDVEVFKSPYDPTRYDYQQNYIKRLIGKPNETIMILDGDIYVADHNSTKLEDFHIQTKPSHAQDALWRIVYDNDFYPQGKSRIVLDPDGRPVMRRGEPMTDPAFKQPWTRQPGESGWDLSDRTPEARTLHFNNLKGSASLYFDADANPRKHALTDWVAYDITANQGGGPGDTYDTTGYTPECNVSDLKLSFFYQRKQGDGALSCEMSKYNDRFIAMIDGANVSLVHRWPNGSETTVKKVQLPHDWSRPTQVEMTNVDYQVSVRIDGQDVITTTPADYHPDVKARLRDYENDKDAPRPSIRIAASKQACELTHVSLWRDIYYLNRGRRPSNDSERTGFWGSPSHFPDNLISLGPEEYFCCGDNSLISQDGRYWSEDINLPDENLKVESGRVPQRFLLGKAFFVYWPSGFRPVDSAPAIVPNFGEMRAIH